MPRGTNWRGGVLGALLLALAACSGDISQESYDQIQVGMTMREVEDVLRASGEKQDTTETSISSAGVMGSQQGRNHLYIWRTTDRKQEIAVEFRDGKVVNKYKTGF